MTFGELLERHEREIFAYALRLTGSRADADDLYQGYRLRATASSGTKPWLPACCNSVFSISVARVRSKPRRNAVSSLTAAMFAASLPTGSPIAITAAAFVLRKVEGRSYAEVADTLGCSEEAARSRVAEAMKKLKEAVR